MFNRHDEDGRLAVCVCVCVGRGYVMYRCMCECGEVGLVVVGGQG